MNRKIIIGGAWPYANSSLHLGHLAALLPGDILARYHRLYGDDVIYISGSDCHGTPITERAKKEKVSPNIIAEKYHKDRHGRGARRPSLLAPPRSARKAPPAVLRRAFAGAGRRQKKLRRVRITRFSCAKICPLLQFARRSVDFFARLF